MTPDDATIIAQGRLAQNALPFLNENAQKLSRSVMNRVFMQIAKGELSPELAYSAWHELYAITRMVSSLRAKAELGVQVAEENADAFNGGKE